MIRFAPTSDFQKSFKRLCKKYNSLKTDFGKLAISLEENPDQGIELGNGFRKIRLAITSKGKGKSGGARVITLNQIFSHKDGFIILVDIYDKSEISNMTLAQIRKAFMSLEQ